VFRPVAYLALLALGVLDAAGYSVIAPVVPAIARATGAGPGVLGPLVATFAVGMAIGFVVAGRGLQRRGAAPVLTGSLAAMALGSVGFVAGEGLVVYFSARFLMGLGSGGLWIGTVFAILERFPREEYRRLTGLLAVYSVGGVAGPALGALGGVRWPFAAYLGLVAVCSVSLAAIAPPRERAAFTSDRAALHQPGFWLASATILLVALALGTLDGPLPLHFAVHLSQAQIALLYVATSVVVGTAAALGGGVRPRPLVAVASVLMVAGIAIAGAVASVPLWLLALALAGAGLGFGESAALGVLLEAIGTERIVLAMVVWSQVWALGYLAGPALGGAIAAVAGFRAIGLVPLAAALLVGVTLSRARAAGTPPEGSRASAGRGRSLRRQEP
jgi:MFS family permease